MGNTQTEVGLMEGDRLVVTERLSTDLKVRRLLNMLYFFHNIFEMCRGGDTKENHKAPSFQVLSRHDHSPERGG